jgi:hypothetical protein
VTTWTGEKSGVCPSAHPLIDSSAPQSARDMHLGDAVAASERRWPTIVVGPSVVLIAAARQLRPPAGRLRTW